MSSRMSALPSCSAQKAGVLVCNKCLFCCLNKTQNRTTFWRLPSNGGLILWFVNNAQHQPLLFTYYCPALMVFQLRRGTRRQQRVHGARVASRGPVNIIYYSIVYYSILYYTIIYYNITYYTILYYSIIWRGLSRPSEGASARSRPE